MPGLVLNVTAANVEKESEYGDGYGPNRYEVVARYRQSDIAKIVVPIEVVEDTVLRVLQLFGILKDGIDQATDEYNARMDAK